MSAVAEANVYLNFDQLSRALKAALARLRETMSVQTADLRDGASPQRPQSATNAQPSEQVLRDLKGVIERGVRTGRILDGFQERNDVQAELDYAAKVYGRYAPDDPLELALAPFDAKELERIEVSLPDFSGVAEEDGTPSAAGIKSYLEGLARGDEALRFEDGLVDELASQLANDPEAWPLLAFTLKQLAAALNGKGNKLRRPANQATIDCRTMLVEHAQSLYRRSDENHKESFRAVLARLGAHAQATNETKYASEGSLRRAGGKPATEILEMLRSEGVAVRRLKDGEPVWVLAHRSLPARWNALSQWVEGRRAKDRLRAMRAGITSGALALLIAGTLGWFQWNAWKIRTANHDAGDALVSLTKGLSESPMPIEERRRVALAAVVKAYESRANAVTYAALFQVVNRVAGQMEVASGAADQYEHPVFSIRFRADGQRLDAITDHHNVVMRPRPQRGRPTEVVFSQNRRYIGVVYDAPSRPGFEIYTWPDGNAIRSLPFDCTEQYTPGSLRISASGQFYGYECTESGPESVVGPLGSDGKAAARARDILDNRMYKVAKSELFVFFDDRGSDDRYVITGHPSGALRIFDLESLEKRAEFVLPLLSVATPRDVAIFESPGSGVQVAVLDRQGIVGVYSRKRRFIEVAFPPTEDRAKAYISTLLPEDVVRWEARFVEFNGLGTCVSVRYAGQPQDPPSDARGRQMIQQYFREETFMLDADGLLQVAKEMIAGSKKVSRQAWCTGDNPPSAEGGSRG